MEYLRAFEKISEKEFAKKCKKSDYENIIIPKRSTKGSCGYDFFTPHDVEIKPQTNAVIYTGIKAKMLENEFLLIAIRSSIGIKRNVTLANNVGIIDSDYYNNEDNEGHIMICLRNNSNEVVNFSKGDKIAQGIFLPYLICDDDCASVLRSGGIGSTGKK